MGRHFPRNSPLTLVPSMPAINRVQSKKQALAGVMRIVPEGTRGAWYVLAIHPFSLSHHDKGLVTILSNAIRASTALHPQFL